VALGEEVVGRWGDRGRQRGGGPREKGRRPNGRRQRSTGRRGGALADDGGALVEVGRALLEDDGVVGGAAVVGDDGGARWENLAAWRRRFVFTPDLENFRYRVSGIYRWNHHWRAT
jgi:hypothetical protein